MIQTGRPIRVGPLAKEESRLVCAVACPPEEHGGYSPQVGRGGRRGGRNRSGGGCDRLLSAARDGSYDHERRQKPPNETYHSSCILLFRVAQYKPPAHPPSR